MRPGDSGSILLAGFLKELGRSSCISLKTVLEFWLASLGSWCLQPLGGRAVLCRGLGVPWSFQVIPALSYLETSYPPSPAAPAALLAAPTSWEGFSPASEPGAGMAGCIQGNGEAQL